MLEGRVLAEQEEELFGPIPNRPGGTVAEVWLNMTVAETIPAGSYPELQFWVKGEFVWAIHYQEDQTYLCIIPPGLPTFALHVDDMFDDCKAEERAK